MDTTLIVEINFGSNQMEGNYTIYSSTSTP